MTGDQALFTIELAILRVRDRLRADAPHCMSVIEALDQLAKEISKIAEDHAANTTAK